MESALGGLRNAVSSPENCVYFFNLGLFSIAIAIGPGARPLPEGDPDRDDSRIMARLTGR